MAEANPHLRWPPSPADIEHALIAWDAQAGLAWRFFYGNGLAPGVTLDDAIHLAVLATSQLDGTTPQHQALTRRRAG